MLSIVFGTQSELKSWLVEVVVVRIVRRVVVVMLVIGLVRRFRS